MYGQDRVSRICRQSVSINYILSSSFTASCMRSYSNSGQDCNRTRQGILTSPLGVFERLKYTLGICVGHREPPVTSGKDQISGNKWRNIYVEWKPRSVDNILMSLVRRLLRCNLEVGSSARDTSGGRYLWVGVGLPCSVLKRSLSSGVMGLGVSAKASTTIEGISDVASVPIRFSKIE